MPCSTMVVVKENHTLAVFASVHNVSRKQEVIEGQHCLLLHLYHRIEDSIHRSRCRQQGATKFQTFIDTCFFSAHARF